MKLYSFILIALVLSCNSSPKQELESTQNDDASPNNEVTLLYETKALLGEGAFWNYKTQEFFWIDILQNELHIYNPSTKSNRTIKMPSPIGTVVPDDASNAIVALEDGIYKVDLNTEEITLLSDVEKEVKSNRFNDGKCDPNGNLWVGSMHYDQSRPEAKVYKIEPDGKTTMMIDSVTISNGIVWSKDHNTMYYIDTPTSKIMAYDYNKDDATVSNPRLAVTVNPEDGSPDGMTIDEEDKLWVGMWNGDAVVRFDPLTGEILTKIEVPAHNVTACAFGGPDLDTLYITTASVDMSDEEKNEKPLAGSLFVVKPGVKGVKGNLFGVQNNHE